MLATCCMKFSWFEFVRHKAGTKFETKTRHFGGRIFQQPVVSVWKALAEDEVF